jgi:type IV secretory pathway VirJ component
MKKIIFILLLFPLGLFASVGIIEDSITHGHFGRIHVYRNSNPPEGVLIYISGDGGWNRGAANMARPFVDMNVVVIGVDYVHFMKSLNNSNKKCLYPAGDFENLSMFLQKKYKLTKYFKPILVGFSSGATLAYALLAQAPANTFKGAIALGFCPDVKSSKPFCSGNGLKWHVLKPGKSYYLDRYEKFTAPFIAFQGDKDMICNSKEVNDFLKGLKNTGIYNLPPVGHGFAVQSRWLTQMKEAVKKIIDFQSFGNKAPIETNPGVNTAAISQLPLYFIKAPDNPDKPLCIVISGDGGWTDFDQTIAETLSKNGITCVGMDTQKYFWEAKTPETTAQDITKVLQYYLPRLQKTSFMLVGYSFGADVIPFIASRLPADLKKRLSLLAMLSPDDKTDFEVTISSMLDLGNEDTYDVLNEIKKVNYTKKLCIFGAGEDDEEMQKSFKNAGAEVTVLGGGHHYNEDYPLIVSSILKHL